jgi:hypothetical protein
MVYIGLLKGAGDTRFHHACLIGLALLFLGHPDLYSRGLFLGASDRQPAGGFSPFRHFPLRRRPVPLSPGPLEIHTCH